MQSNSQSAGRGTGAILFVACGAPFLVALDMFVVNVAFDTIAADFGGAELTAVSWTLSAYAITFAALLIPLGGWSDRVGNRRGFVTGVAVFTVGSALAAAAPTLGVLIASRVLQAVGAAALTPASLALLVTSMPPERRAGAIRIWAATSGMAAALGPVIGGVLVEFSWRAAFLINVPIGIGFVVAALRLFRGRSAPGSAAATGKASTGARPGRRGTVDAVLGAGLLASAGALAVLYLVQGDRWGWASPASLSALIAAVVLGSVFVVVDRHSADPLIPPALFADRGFTLGSASMLLFSAAFAAGLLNAILLLQQAWGYSVLLSGLAVAPGPLMVPLTTTATAGLSRRISPWILAAAGAALWALGMALIGLTAAGARGPSYAAGFLPGWLLGGVGVGLVMPGLLANVTAGLSATMAGRGSAVVTMARQMGITIGTSALVAVLAAGLGTASWWIVAAVSGAAALVALGPLRRTTLPDPIAANPNSPDPSQPAPDLSTT
ncbi:MFS transporter [Gordonia sp. NPDC003429]